MSYRLTLPELDWQKYSRLKADEIVTKASVQRDVVKQRLNCFSFKSVQLFVGNSLQLLNI